jgi:hypothetical protein
MPNTRVPATGEAMPAAKINRRKLLGGSAAVIATATSPAAAADGSELARLIQAHKDAYAAFNAALETQEMAEAKYEQFAKSRMVQIGHGRFREVQPSYSTPWWELRDDLRKEVHEGFEQLRARVPAALSEPVRSSVIADLNRSQRAVYRSLVSSLREIAADQERAGLLAAWEAVEEWSNKELETSMAVLAYPCRTMDECRLKAEYAVNGRGMLDNLKHGADGAFVDALLASFLGTEA